AQMLGGVASTFTLGAGFTVMYCDAVAPQPVSVLVPMAVYRVLIRGFTVTTLPVPALLLQVTTSAPVAVRMTFWPAQTVLLLATMASGGWFRSQGISIRRSSQARCGAVPLEPVARTAM